MGSTPTAAAAPINHVLLKHPKHELLFVQCRNSGRQFLVYDSSAVTLSDGAGENCQPQSMGGAAAHGEEAGH